MLSCESALLLAAGAPDSFSSSAVASASSSLCPTPCFWLLRLPGGDGVLAPVAFSMLTPNDPRTGRREQSNGYLQEWYHHIPAAETVAVSQADSQLFHGPAPFRVSYFAHTPDSPRSLHHRLAVRLRRAPIQVGQDKNMYLHVQRYAGNMQDTRLVESCGIASFQSNETSHKFKYKN